MILIDVFLLIRTSTGT